MNKYKVLLCGGVLMLSLSVNAATAICSGKIERIVYHAPDGFFKTFEYPAYKGM